NQDYPFEELVEKLEVDRDASRNPLFDVLFVQQNIEANITREIPGLRITPYPYETGTSKFDMQFTAVERRGTLSFNLEYSTRLFREDTVQRMIGLFKKTISALMQNSTQNPDLKLAEIEIIGKKEKEEILRLSMGERETFDDSETIHHVLQQNIPLWETKTALDFQEQELTYGELNRKSNLLAALLRKKGVAADTVVGLLAQRSFEMIIGVLGIIKAGGACLTIDSDYPAPRKNYMLVDSAVKLVLTNCDKEELTGFIPEGIEVIDIRDQRHYKGNDDGPVYHGNGSNMVYMVYTSGSTGKPKGIMMEHRSILNLVRHQFNHTGINFSRVLQFTTISFDVFFQEVFSTLLAGGRLYLIPKEIRGNVPQLFEFIKRNAVKTLFLPASFLKFVLNEEEYIESLPGTVEHIVAAGEQLIVNDRFKKYLRGSNVMLHNHYGPAETHVVTTLTLDPANRIPARPSIGKPVINTGIYILDKKKHLQPVGVIGELVVGGLQVSRGYWQREELTAEKFIPANSIPGIHDVHKTQPPNTRSPIPGSKLYRTGDLARWLGDGNIEFQGRVDHQVKIRGFRIEPGEIENIIMGIETIKEVVVIDREATGTSTDPGGEIYLCAYLVAEEKIDPTRLRNTLAGTLPDYMVPAYFVQLDKIPLTPNKKVDRNALPEPVLDETSDGISAPVSK
ncbi:MAG: amino acid adenylation domain-containing protein, partial [bacterium]|nr:amino acid adenylation domain-containing protein [bacterium]